MSNVIKLRPDTADALRNIADDIESGYYHEHCSPEATLIIGTEVCHFGCKTAEEAAVNAVWNMVWAITKLMNAAHEDEE